MGAKNQALAVLAKEATDLKRKYSALSSKFSNLRKRLPALAQSIKKMNQCQAALKLSLLNEISETENLAYTSITKINKSILSDSADRLEQDAEYLELKKAIFTKNNEISRYFNLLHSEQLKVEELESEVRCLKQEMLRPASVGGAQADPKEDREFVSKLMAYQNERDHGA